MSYIFLFILSKRNFDFANSDMFHKNKTPSSIKIGVYLYTTEPVNRKV